MGAAGDVRNSSSAICVAEFAGVAPATQKIGFDLLTCISGGCKDECATTARPQDGGETDGGDAGDGG